MGEGEIGRTEYGIPVLSGGGGGGGDSTKIY